ncbi:hypothetical protein G6F40_013929 [Rhizopus arrhizus]|nr:hypothetical protein G6F40_013929 [Rhizopus arrhizus]
MAPAAIGLGVLDEIRVAEGHAVVGETIHRLLPADHPVGAVVEDQHHQVQAQPARRFQLLAVHHETAIPAHRQYPPLRVQARGHDRRRQARAHRRQRVVQQQRIGHLGAVVAREPDLVHAVVQRHDAVRWHHLADVVHQPLRGERLLLGTVGDVLQDGRAQRQQRIGVRHRTLDAVGQLGQRAADVTDHLHLREVHLFHRCLRVADMDHGRAARAHHERRLFSDLVADGDDHVGLVDRHVHVVALGQRRGAHVQARATGNRTLAHLRGEERNAGTQHER